MPAHSDVWDGDVVNRDLCYFRQPKRSSQQLSLALYQSRKGENVPGVFSGSVSYDEWLPRQGRHGSLMEVSDLSNSTNFLSHGAGSVLADIRVLSKKSQLVVRLFKPKRRIRAGHGALER